MSTKTEHKIRRVRIVQDEDPMSPREWDNVGIIVAWHRSYDLSDDGEKPDCDSETWMRNLAADQVNADDADLIPLEHVQRILEKYFVMLPVFMYDHSGITLSTSDTMFRACDSVGWDWGQLGIIYCTMEKAREEWDGSDEDARKKAVSRMTGEIAVYDQYVMGDVWGYVCEEATVCDHGDVHWDTLDSCWGFFGTDAKENGMRDAMGEEWLPLLDKAVEDI